MSRSAALNVPAPSEAEQALLNNPDWRLRNLYYVINEAGKRVRFEPNWAQSELFAGLGHKNVDLKVRQIGITTGYCMLWLDLAFFNPNVAIGIVAHTKDAVGQILRGKIKYAYDNLPDELKALNPIVIDNAEELSFKNGSSIRVGVTFRSGTLQVLHVSEFGYTCANFPARAKEVVTGSMQAVHDSGIIVIESTAEEAVGKFAEICENAQTPGTEWTFRFLPWWKDPDYIRPPPEGFIEYHGEQKYLDELCIELKTILTVPQRCWWCFKRRALGDDVYKQFPSTPAEAFKVTNEHAYYRSQMLDLASKGRITEVPFDRSILVDTWWDLGINDSMAIWLVQNRGFEVRIIGYYENSGEGLPHYVKYLQDWSMPRGAIFGRHVAPHDIKVRELNTGASRLESAAALGIRFEVAPQLPIIDGIERVRSFLGRCWFDARECEEGVKALRAYSKQWDPKREVYLNQPLHNWASHGADAFRTGVVASDSGIVGPVQRRRHAVPIARERWR
jgi:hypothetical protein